MDQPAPSQASKPPSIKLNLGCGERCHFDETWIDVDLNPAFNPDLVANAEDLSEHFAQSSVDEIYAGHLLEHCYEPVKVLRHWHGLLRSGGRLGVVIPDCSYILTTYPPKEAWDMLWISRAHGYSGPGGPAGHSILVDRFCLYLWLTHVGFARLEEISGLAYDPRLEQPLPWQSGYDAWK